MATGPVEYVVLGFPGNQFKGEVVPELVKLVDSGTIRIIDLVVVVKDGDGNVMALEVDEHEALVMFTDLDGEVGGIIGDEDIEHAGEGLEPNSSAALLIWEDLWAVPLVDALRNAAACSSRARGSPTISSRRRRPSRRPRTEGRTKGATMLRRRPIARVAVTTAVVAGTATGSVDESTVDRNAARSAGGSRRSATRSAPRRHRREVRSRCRPHPRGEAARGHPAYGAVEPPCPSPLRLTHT